MIINKQTFIFYVISFIIACDGFALIFLTRTTLILATGVILVIVGLFLFLIVEEMKAKTRRQYSTNF